VTTGSVWMSRKSYCQREGYQHVLDYVDAGYSGTSKNRPNFQEMLKDI
jgi:DNA invertase Pin-like site-specific DNA recombinase